MKVERAGEHLTALDREWQAFLGTEPHTFVVQKDGNTTRHLAYFGKCDPPPPFLSVLAGEALYQLRSTLEHLVWTLVEAHGTHKPGTHNSFPVFEIEPKKPFETVTTYPLPTGKNARRGAGRLLGVCPTAVALIEQAQPYHCRDRAKYHPFAVLDELAKADRHRFLVPSWSALDPAEGVRRLFHPDPGYELSEFEWLFEGNLRLEAGTHIARFTVLPSSGLQCKVDMHGQFPALVAFGIGEGRAIPALTLWDTQKRLRKFIERFAAFVPA